MGFVASLAWKNLSRYRRRSLITAVAITAGIGIYIGADSMFSGIGRDSERNFIRYEAGAAQVMDGRFFKDMDTLPLSFGIPDPGAIQAALKPLGARTTARIRFPAELFTDSGSQQVTMQAMDPATDGPVLRLRECVSQGRYLDGDGQGILLGWQLAEDLKAAPGDGVTLRTRTRDGAFQTAELEVIGILDSPNPYLNQGAGFVSLAFADGLLEMGGSVTEVLIGAGDFRRPEDAAVSAAEALRAAFPTLVVKSWRDLGRDFINLVEVHQNIYGLLLFLVFVIAAVGISNTMLMAVYERFREIGMMRALGMKDGALRLAFVLEAGGIGLIGSLGGVILGASISFFLVRWGIDYSALMGRMQMGYRINGVFRGAWNPMTMAWAFLFGIAVSMAVAVVPASRALRRGITACLTHT